jgi:hypothetical protein
LGVLLGGRRLEAHRDGGLELELENISLGPEGACEAFG